MKGLCLVFKMSFCLLVIAFLCAIGHGEPKAISGCKILDLTHELSSKTPYYPVYKPFNLTFSFRGKRYLFVCLSVDCWYGEDWMFCG